MIFIEPTSKPH